MNNNFTFKPVRARLVCFFFAFLTFLWLSFDAKAQLSGTKTICTSGCDYSSISSAVAALNSSGVGSGGVTFDIASGFTETLTAPIIVTATGTASRPIMFYNGSGGTHPKITAYTGTGTLDGIFILAGSDYVTIDGIDLEESSSNSTVTTRMEWGYALLKKNASSTPDGASYNIIQNCKITLNKAHTGSSGLVSGCVGIYMANHIATSTTSYAYSDTTSNSSNYNKFYSNDISNVYHGIYASGYSGNNGSYDVGNQFGAFGLGNQITNFGGSSFVCYGIYSTAQNRVLIEGNTVRGGDATTSTLYGIYSLTGTNSTIRIRSNTITLTPILASPTSTSSSTNYGIFNSAGSSGTTNLVEITDNQIRNCNFANNGSGAFYGIYNTGAGYTVRVERNQVKDNVFGSSSLTSTGAHYNFYYSASNTNAGSTLSIAYNSVKNYQRQIASGGAGGITYGFYFGGGNMTSNVTEDTITGNTYRATTSTLYEFYFTPSGAINLNVFKNYVYNNSRVIATSGQHYHVYITGSTTAFDRIYNNKFSGPTMPTSGYTGTMYGIYNFGSSTFNYIYGNKIYDINAGGGTLIGIYQGFGLADIYNNIIGNLSATYSNNSPAIRAIDVTGGSGANVYHNTVYIGSTSSTGTSFGSCALYTSISLPTRINNNIFINMATPGSGTTGRTVAHWRNGVSPNQILLYSQNNIYYAGTPGTKNFIYWDGTLGCQTMQAYQRRVKIADMGSASENVSFASTTGGAANFLFPSTSSGTRVESNGISIPAITDDFSGNKRHGTSSYSGTGSGPDIGAVEDNFTAISPDQFPPSILGVDAPVSCSSTSGDIVATIIDRGGVPVSGGNRPRVYFKKGKGGSFSSVAGTLVSGNMYTGNWKFTLNYSSLGSYAVGDTVYAYCIVQDSASTPNISSFPGGVSASNVNSITTAPRDTFFFRIRPAGMGGTYTVGSTSSDFSSITAAVTALNSAGLCSPVTISIKPGTYRERVSVGAIAGTSRTNTLTFQSSTGKAEDVVVIDSALSSTNPYVWQFNGTQYASLRNVTLLAKGTIGFGWGLNIMGNNTTRNIKVKGCNIWLNDSNNTSSGLIPLVVNNSGSSYSSGGKVDSLEIDSNSFRYGYFGVVIYGSGTTSRTNDVYFRNNSLYGAYYYGTYILYTSGFRFENNILRPKLNATTMQFGLYAISMGQYLNSAASRIVGNQIYAGLSYTMFFSSCDNSVTDKGLIANNMIVGPGNYGIYLSSSNYWNLYHNSINMFNPTSNYTHYAIYNVTTTTNEYKNNILALNSTFSNTSNHALYLTAANPAGTVDNNIYYNPFGTNLIFNGVGYNAGNFNTSTAGGTGSKILKPAYYSNQDLRVGFSCQYRVPYIGTVPVDIFNTARSTTANILGAHQASPSGNDVELTSILTPSYPVSAGTQKVRIRIANSGSNALSKITLSYQVSGGSPVSQTFTLSPALATCDTTSLVLTTGFTHTSGCFTLRAWSSDPNGSADQFNGNDTSAVLSMGIPVSGTYTIGGSSPDFATINTALNSLLCGGVSGPVTLSIRPGVYREKVSVPNILGTSNTNWITFTSSTGNPSDVIIIDSTMSTSFVGNHYGWRFDNAKYMTLRGVTVQIKGIYGWGIHIVGANSKQIRIKRCNSFIVGDTTSTSTFNIPLVVNGSITSLTTGAKVDSIEIDSCQFRYGYANVSIWGSSSTSRCDEIYFRNNYCYGPTSLGGIYSSSISGLRFQNNMVQAQRSAGQASYGFYFTNVGQYLNSAATEISGNKVLNPSSYGLFLSSCSNSSSARGLMSNNMVAMGGSYGIFMSSSDFWDVFHNSVNMYTGTPGYAYYNTTTGNIIENNIFAITSPSASTSGYAAYCSNSVGSGNLDYNLYWNPSGTYIIYHAGAYTTSTYKTSSAGGANSNVAKPPFLSNTDLRVINVCAGNGTPLSRVTKDYFGNSRSTTAPIIGAHEPAAVTYSASATRIVKPASSAISVGPSYDIDVEVKNTGSTTITSLAVSYSLNGNVVSNTFTGLSIPTCGLDTVSFTGSFAATFSAGYNEVIAFTGQVNSNNDQLNLDDTSAAYGFCATLSGNYTINPSGSGSGNFKSFRKAVTALYTCGITGPVTITASAGTYNEQVSFPGLIPGANSNNTVTFNGVDASKCKITTSSNMSDPRHVVQFIGVKHLRFLNIGIENTSPSFGWGISMKANGSQANDSVLIKGCIITVDQSSTNTNFAGIVISNSNTGVTTSGANAHNVTLDSNTINGGYYGLTMFGAGTGTNKGRNNRITRNTFNNQYYYGMYLYYQDSLEVSSNKMNNLGRAANTAGYGMYTYYNDFTRVTKNKFCGQSGGYGLYCQYSTGSSARPCQFVNNMFNIGLPGTSNSVYGILAYYGIYCDYIYNSVNVYGNSNSTAFYGYFYSGSSYNNNRVYNNNFTNNGAGYAMYVQAGSNTDARAALRGMDNNNYFTRGNYTFNFINTIFNGLSTWTSSTYMGSSFDTLSKNLDPEYMSSCDLHTLSLLLDSAGVPIAGYNEDIDGDVRNSVKSDIGADEYTPPKNNLGPVVILKPNAPTAAGMTDVWVSIRNFGADSINSATVKYKVGKNGTVKSLNYSGKLGSMSRDTVRFTGSNQHNLVIGNKDTLIAFTELPNGKSDGFPANDTIRLTICAALAGNYTIGGSSSSTNFTTWNEASVSLSSCGISAPVVLNVMPNTYTEQVVFNAVPGAWGNNTVTIRSNDGNPASVKLQYAAPAIATSNYTLILRGAKRFIIRDLTLASSGTYPTNYGTVVKLDNNGTTTSDSNLFYNNVINGISGANTTSNLYANVYTVSQYHQYNRFARNTINDGSYGIYHGGNAVIPLFNKGVSLDSNTINNFYYMGLYLTYSENANISFNRVVSSSFYGSKYGIYYVYGAKGGNLRNNYVNLSNDATYGIFNVYGSYPGYSGDSGKVKIWNVNNNIILQGTSSTGKYGLYSYYSSNTNIYHNTININGSGNGMYLYGYSGDSAINVVNNTFVTEVSGTPAMINGTLSAFKRVDNNNYFNRSSSGPIAQLNSSYIYSAASLPGMLYTLPSRSDLKSVSVNPQFLSTTDLHVRNPALATAGSGVGISKDFDNRDRNSVSPTIGAFEYAGDLRVSEIVSPASLCASSTPVTIKIKVKNVGYAPATSYSVSYRIGKGAIATDMITTPLNAGDSAIIDHTVKGTFNSSGVQSVSAFTTYVYDINLNDTFTGSVDVFYSPKPAFSVSDTCYSATTGFTSKSTVTNSTISSNTWKFGDGNAASGVSVSNKYSGGGVSYLVTLTSTSAQGCVDSTKRYVLILTPLNPGSIGTDQSICYNTTPALLTTKSSASGSQAPYLYQWQVSSDSINFSDINGATNLDFQPGALTSTRYYRRQVKTVSGCGPVYSNVVRIIANPVLNAGVIGSPQTICYNGTGTALTFSTQPSGSFGAGSYTYQWQQSSDSATWSVISGETGSSYVPSKITSVTYFRVLVASGTCPKEGTNGVKIKLYAPITGGTIASGQTICAGTTPAAFTQVSAPAGGPGTYAFQWQSSTDSINWNDISGATSSTYGSGVLSQLTYFQRLATSTGCPSGISNAIKVRTNPKPNISFTASNHCFNDAMPLTNSSSISSGTLNYRWNFGDGTTSTSSVPNKTYSASGTYNVTLAATSNLGCKDSATKSVVVATTPTANFSFALKCQGDSVIFTDQTVYACYVAGLQFHWNFGDGTTSNVQHARKHYSSPGTYNVKFRISLPGGFKDSMTKTVVFNIRSKPAFSATNVCSPEANAITNTSTGYASLLWTFGDGTSSTTTSSSFTKSYSSPGSYTVKLLSLSSFGCRDSVVKTVTQFSKPTASFSAGNSCIGTSTTFSNGSTGANSYLWRFGNGTTSTNVNPTITYGASGTYNVTLIVYTNNGCQDSVTKSVTIYPNPTVGFTTANVCKGSTSSFTNTSTGASTYKWDFGNGNTSTATNPTYSYPTSGSYTVSLTATTSNGCSQSTSQSYTVFATPTASFSGSNVCIGNTISFANSSSGASSYSWNFGDGSTSTTTSPVKSYSTSGTFNVKLVVVTVNGCKDSITKQVVIYPKPVVNFSAGNQCLGTAVNFTNQTTGAVNYVWSFGNGASSATTSPSYSYPASGTYNVKLVAESSFGCKDSITKTVTVYPNPGVNFTASPNPICRGGLMNFNNTTTNGASYTWNFGNGKTSTLTSPTNIYTTEGNYNVKLVSTSTNGCKDSIVKTVTVWPRPKASFSANNGCTGDNLNFATNSTGAVGHAWTFGDGSTSTQANPAKGYASAGTYNVTLIVTSVNGCLDTTTSSVTVHPRASVSFTNSSNFCVGNTASFTNTSTLSSGNMTFQWKFGDGNTSSQTNPTNTYATGGNYTVTLTATTDKGCSNSATGSVLVYSRPTANFNAKDVCQGNAITFNNTSAGATSYAWDFGDGGTSTLASPTRTYTSAGTYTVKLTVTNANGCSDVMTRTVVVNSNPVASFTVADRCIGQSVSFTNTSTGATDVAWQFGDGGTSYSLNPVYTYAKSGSYTVTLTVRSSAECVSTTSRTVTIFPGPRAAFSVNDPGQCVNGNAFVFTDNTTISSGTYTRSWTLGDGGTSTSNIVNKTYTGAGSYTVKLVVTGQNGCKDSVSDVAMVYPKPVANFNINKPVQCINGHLFSFTDASTLSDGTMNRTWDMGDGSSESGSSVVKQYASAGSYTVKLTVTSDYGCTDNISKTVTLNTSPSAGFTINNKTQCQNGNLFNFTNTSFGTGFTSTWRLGDGNTQTTTNASRSYANPGNYKVTLNVATPGGCADSAYYFVTVLASPATITITGPTTVANGSKQTYTVPYTAGSTYNWVATNGTVLSNGSNTIQVTWSNSGAAASLTVTETNTNGCPGAPASLNVALYDATGLGTVYKNEFAARLYPNPTRDKVNVEVSTGDMVNLQVFDQMGREVISGIRFNRETSLSGHHLSAGIYIMRLTTDQGRSTLLRFEVQN